MADNKELLQLKKEIERHNKLYHEQDNPEISDAEYDALYQRLQELENILGVDQDSPTQQVGASTSRKFEKHNHLKPMLSLSNVFSDEDFYKFEERVLKRLNTDKTTFSVEPKFDGIGISLTYENGNLTKAVTRGDGVTGEVVTNNIKTIAKVPHVIEYSSPKTIEIRGEVFFRLDDFSNINTRLEADNLKTFVSPRNAAAGTLRNLDIEIVKQRPLDIYFYGIGGHSDDAIYKSYEEFVNFLKKNNFPVCDLVSFGNAEHVVGSVSEILSSREDLDYEIDGAVVKVNDFLHQQKLGFVSKAPRWAVAWKFPASEKYSKVIDILFSVGRTGIVTPYATVEPVLISGANISNVTLHNMDELSRLDIKVNDTVLVKRAGDVIPQITKVNVDVRDGSETNVNIPSQCPSCGNALKTEGPFMKCDAGMRCPAQLLGYFEHFVSRKAMNIDGLGYKINESLINLGFVSQVADLFKLRQYESKLKSLEGFGEKSIDNLFSSIEAATNPTLEVFINSLGIPEVGESTAAALARHFKSFDVLRSASFDELMGIDSIGDIVANKILNFFESDPIGIDALLEVLMVQDFQLGDLDHLDGLKIVITGSFDEFSREELKDLIKERGGIPSSGVSSQTNYVILGENPGSKHKKALDLGIKIITEENIKEFLKV